MSAAISTDISHGIVKMSNWARIFVWKRGFSERQTKSAFAHTVYYGTEIGCYSLVCKQAVQVAEGSTSYYHS